MNASEYPAKNSVQNESASRAHPLAAPWRQLAVRIQEALGLRNFYLASSEDLGALWREERIDAVERRRRITVFAAQHHWQVDARPDGRAARFQSGMQQSPIRGEFLSRNHE